MAKLAKSKKFECIKCRKPFGSLEKLKKHSKTHPELVSKEIKLLQSGKLPDMSKAGSGFKGKNKVIIT